MKLRTDMDALTDSWWADAVVYHVYIRSFADSNNDGVGDLRGLISKLDYLEWLGVDAIWCSPVTKSANRDLGYDVTDYCDVDPTLGTLEDFDDLLTDAHGRGMRVLLDFVPNHTSIDHPWFTDADKRDDYYIWSDEPNNWVSTFHIPMWTYHEEQKRYYLHSYLPEQPDLNWRSERLRAEFDDTFRFWLDRGVDGFRIDACYLLIKDEWLRDNPPASLDDHEWDRHRGQRPVHNSNRPEVHELLRHWRSVLDEYERPRVMTGSTWVPDVHELVTYFGDNDELHLPQDSRLLFSDFTPELLKGVVESWLDVLKPSFTPMWIGSSHDFSRMATRWADGDRARARVALAMLLTLPGTCVLFQGDELGMEDVFPGDGTSRDGAQMMRDLSRSPIPWSTGAYGGFSTIEPWTPLGIADGRDVASQMNDRSSTLHFTRRMISEKKGLWGDYEPLESPTGTWSYRRGDRRIDLNFDAATVEIETIHED